jgi:hypothetical protein
MKFNPSLKTITFIFASLLSTHCAYSLEIQLWDTLAKPAKKKLHIPTNVWQVPKNNNFKNDTSEYCYKRMKESENIAIFWAKKFGNNPMANPDSSQRFNVDEILKESERIYNYYVNVLKFVEKKKSITDKYKCLIFIIDSKERTAFGGGEENKVGIFWAPPIRMNKKPFGALAHELGHSIQYLLKSDKAKGDTTLMEEGGSYSFVEMTSQFMLWQVYSEWMTFENYHLVDFMKQTYYAFLHEKNMYHSPYVLEYWSNKHGMKFIGKMWREGEKGEDPVMTYKRLTSVNQKEFNDEIFDAARRFITWDMKRIERIARPYANQHFSKLDSIGDKWYRINVNNCPQNYGYNGIKLKIPPAGTVVALNFKGIAGTEDFRTINIDKAGWRYGFLAVTKNGRRIYGKVYSDLNGIVKFKVPKKTQHLWLVVSGAPSEHWIHDVDGKDENDEQWPYQIKLAGTSLDD